MPTAFRPRWIAFAGFFLVAAGLAGAPGADESPQTARAALGKARQEATRWHADAKLIGVGARVDAEGFSNNDGPNLSEPLGFAAGQGVGAVILDYPDGWNYTFSSPLAHQRLYIRVYRGGLATTEEQLPTEQPGSESGQQGSQISKPLPAAFLDSDQAMAVARKSGFSVEEGRFTPSPQISRTGRYKFRMELTNSLDTPVKESLCWQVTDAQGTSFFVSAESGKLLAKVSPDH